MHLKIFYFRKLKAILEEHKLVEKDIMGYITNPLNAFAIIKRATSDINLIVKRFPDETKQFLENIKDIRPSDEDLSGATEGLLRLQTIYKLQSVDFAKGIIDGKKTRKPFTLHDLFVIGEEALKMKNQNYFAIEYLEMVWMKLNEGVIDEDVDNNVLLHHLTTCFNMVGHFDRALHYVDKLIENSTDKNFVNLKQELLANKPTVSGNMLAIKNPFSDDIRKDGSYQIYKEYILYSQVCRGNVTKNPSELSELHCRYISNSPFTKLAPFKVEEANLDPYIVLYIDVLSDNQIEYLTRISKNKVEPAQILDKKLKRVKSSSRVAQNSWHFDYKDAVVSKISQLVEVRILIHAVVNIS